MRAYKWHAIVELVKIRHSCRRADEPVYVSFPCRRADEFMQRDWNLITDGLDAYQVFLPSGR